MPHINFELTDDLLDRIRRASYERGTTRKEFVVTALEAEVRRHVYGPRVKRASPVDPGRGSSDPSDKRRVEKVTVAVETTASISSSDQTAEAGSVTPPITIEPPYHTDTRMPLEDAVRAIFPKRLQSEIERSIRGSG